MNDKEILEKLYGTYKVERYDKPYIYEKRDYPYKEKDYDYEKWWKIIKEKEKEKDFNIDDVLKKFTLEELINAIGIENVELYLRNLKLKKIKENLK